MRTRLISSENKNLIENNSIFCQEPQHFLFLKNTIYLGGLMQSQQIVKIVKNWYGTPEWKNSTYLIFINPSLPLSKDHGRPHQGFEKERNFVLDTSLFRFVTTFLLFSISNFFLFFCSKWSKNHF